MGLLAGGEPRVPDAVGTDLAARRPDARRLSAAPEALRRGSAHRPGLPVLPVPPRRRCAGGRIDALQCAPRRRPGRQPRLEAACIPSNIASVRLLEKTGFTREGFAREYLCINGLWQDHLLYALL